MTVLCGGFTAALDNVDFNRLVEICGQEKSSRQLHSFSRLTMEPGQQEQQQQSWQM